MATRPFDTSPAAGDRRERARRLVVLANEAVGGERVSPEKPADPPPDEADDERVDREAEETFPASDPPANY